MAKYLLLIPIIFLLVGCQSLEEQQKINENRQKEEFQNCINAGGVPIGSSWSWTMKDCKFKQ